MSTKALIDRIVPYAKGWSRTGTRSILDLIQRYQDVLFDQDSPYSEWVGTDNKGFPPYLKTTSGVFRYNLTAANLQSVASLVKTIGGTDYTVRAKRILKVFVDLSQTTYTRPFVGEPFIFFTQNPYSVTSSRVKGGEVAVRSWPCLETTVAGLDFQFDPGTTTTDYFVQFTYEPPRLTAETVPLCVPQDFEEALRDAVLGEIQMLSNGSPNEFQQKFLSYWIPLWNRRMSGGAQNDNLEVQPVYC